MGITEVTKMEWSEIRLLLRHISRSSLWLNSNVPIYYQNVRKWGRTGMSFWFVV